MPASQRARASRTTTSKPYGRREPPAQVDQSLATHYLPASSALQYSADVDTSGTNPSAEALTPVDRPGLPTYADYKQIEARYLHSLSPRKRDKALITQVMFDKIWDVLHEPEACAIDTPQFRFWVRKMFTLSRPVWVEGAGEGGSGGWEWSGERADGTGTGTGDLRYPASDSDAEAEAEDLALEREMGIGVGTAQDTDAYLVSAVVLHENRPVAVMEQLYELFCYCHVRAGHGGRDKTCAVIRQHYSWVPKELTAQFVKACPTCAMKRSGGGLAHMSIANIGVGVGMDKGVQKRGAGQKEKRTRRTSSEGRETVAPVQVPSSLGAGWLTTGGPLDPANPEPCGVRERERRERAWLHVREDQRSSPVSPKRALVSYSTSPLKQSAADASPFRLYDMTCSQGTGTCYVPQPQPLATESSSRARGRSGDQYNTSSPMRTETGLPSLASALSNESLDLHLHLTELGGDTGDSECRLPHVLQPLRLSGPCTLGPSSSSSPSSTSSLSSSSSDNYDSPSHLFQIDPVLLSFDYPGLVCDLDPLEASGSASNVNAPVMSKGRAPGGGRHHRQLGVQLTSPNAPADLGRGRGHGRGRERRISPERPSAAATAIALSLSTERVLASSTTTRRRGLAVSSPSRASPYGYYRRDNGPDPFDVLYPHRSYCATDDPLGGIGQERDGTLSPLAIMTDA